MAYRVEILDSLAAENGIVVAEVTAPVAALAIFYAALREHAGRHVAVKHYGRVILSRRG